MTGRWYASYHLASATVFAVIVLLPPSETKRPGGDGPPLRLEALSVPELTPLRTALLVLAIYWLRVFLRGWMQRFGIGEGCEYGDGAP